MEASWSSMLVVRLATSCSDLSRCQHLDLTLLKLQVVNRLSNLGIINVSVIVIIPLVTTLGTFVKDTHRLNSTSYLHLDNKVRNKMHDHYTTDKQQQLYPHSPKLLLHLEYHRLLYGLVYLYR